MATEKQKIYWESMKGHKGHFNGRKHTDQTKEKISLKRIGIVFTPEHLLNMSLAQKGKKRSPEWCKKNGDRFRGENHYRWAGGEATRLVRRAFYERKRVYLKKNNSGNHTLEQWEELKKKFNYICLCCKKSEPEVSLTEDHIVPLSRGGSNDIGNIQPLCRSCNSVKLTQTFDFRQLYATLNQDKS